MNSWPTSAFRSMPRVTTLRRCSSGSSGGSNDSHTSASIIVSALPGCPTGTCRCRRRGDRRRVPGRRARGRDCSSRAGSPAAPATAIVSTVPTAGGAAGRGGIASAMSAAATRNPSSIARARPRVRRPGPRRRPDGTPYIHDEAAAGPRRSTAPARRTMPASATGASPSPSPPSQRDTVQPVAGSSPAAGRGISSSGSSRIVARQARNEAVSSGSSDSGSRTSRITRDSARSATRGRQPRPAGAVQNDQRAAAKIDQVADAEHVADRPRPGHRDHVAEERQVRVGQRARSCRIRPGWRSRRSAAPTRSPASRRRCW